MCEGCRLANGDLIERECGMCQRVPVAEMRIAFHENHENHERARAPNRISISLLFHIRHNKVKICLFVNLFYRAPFNKVTVVLRLPAKSNVSTTISALFPAYSVFCGVMRKDFPDRSRPYFALYSTKKI